MPIVWRYLWRHYFQIFALCVSAFISVLIVLRFQEIARFATSGASVWRVGLFACLQIPYILPIAVPVSCLIATLLLCQRLSHAQELTALRTAGMGLKRIIAPLLFAGAFLSIANFTIASEVAPRCRSAAKQLIFSIATNNPLFLLQKESLVKLKTAYYDIGKLKSPTHAEDVLFVIKNSSSGRMSLLSAKELLLHDDLLLGKKVSFISSVDPELEGFDHLIIENQEEMNTRAQALGQFLHAVDWKASEDYLSMHQLLASGLIKTTHLSLSKGAQVEIYRRLSLGLCALSFTLIGLGFGLHIGRNRSKRGLFFALALAASFLICFMAAKSFHASPGVAAALFLVPHAVIVLCSLYALRRIVRGVE